ncbi:MAG: hypothetical protein P1Q69_18930, partial [Candidatus Thorarchaeota archaeon]|nr:hypothetical protein [Candidatus Thorarchaeota archaeon]
VSDSGALMHLFLACDSKNILRFGNEESGKKLYTVPGSRPAEISNVEITSTIMLALGLNSEYVEEYRRNGLTEAQVTIESESQVHVMDFEQIVLDEIETIDNSYSDSYTSTHRIYRFSVDLLGCMVVQEVRLFAMMGDGSLPILIEDGLSIGLDAIVGLSFSLALTAITIFEVLWKTAPASPWVVAAGGAAAAAVMFYFYLTLATVWNYLRSGAISWGKAASWFLGLVVGLLLFVLPGFELAGRASKEVIKWAEKRIVAQLGENVKDIVGGIIKSLIWAKIFFVICLVLFTSGFVICAINSF